MGERDWSRIQEVRNDPLSFKACCGPVPFELDELTRLGQLLGGSLYSGVAAALKVMLYAEGQLSTPDMKLRGDVWRVIAQRPWFERLYGLDLDGERLRVEDLAQIAAWGDCAIERLSLKGNRLDEKKVMAFLEAEWLERLRRLVLSSNSLSTAAAQRLFGSQRLRHVRELMMDQCKLTDEALRCMTADTFRDLNQWDIRHNLLEFHELGDDFALPSSLSWLDMRANPVQARGAAAFARAAGIERLEHLNIGHCPLGDLGVVALAQANFSGMKELLMPGVGVGDSGAAALAANDTFTSLDQVMLIKNKIGDEGARALAQAPWLSRVRSLSLRYNPIGDEGVKAFLAREDFGQLWSLSLSESKLGKEGRRAYKALMQKISEQARARRAAEARQDQ